MFDRTKLKRSITNDRKNATETKPISRFATLTPGENIKEKQVSASFLKKSLKEWRGGGEPSCVRFESEVSVK